MTNKYIIEVEETYVSADSYEETSKVRPEKLYRIKGFNSLVFDESGLNKLTEYHEDEPVEDNYPKSVRWKPKLGEKYYYINENGRACLSTWNEYAASFFGYEIGNVFKTKEDAEFEVERLKVLAELKEYADDDKEWDEDNTHWNIGYETNKGCIEVHSYCYTKTTSFNLYFSSEEQAQKAIDTIGEERLKKYYFCVEDNENE